VPIIASDIQYRLSGGASNSDPLLSIGGIKSSTASGAGIFDDVSSAEALAGDTEYRCIYIHNAHATLTYTAARIWVQTNTPSADTTVALALGNAAVNATETAVANENTAPSGPTFSAPTDYAGGIAIGDIPAGQHRAVWERRTVTAGAAVYADSFTLRVQGDTLP